MTPDAERRRAEHGRAVQVAAATFLLFIIVLLALT